MVSQLDSGAGSAGATDRLIGIPDRPLELDYSRTLLHNNVRRGFLFFAALASVVILASAATGTLAGGGALARRVSVKARVGQPPIRETPQPAAETIAHDLYEDLRIMAEAEKQPAPNILLLRRAFSGAALDGVLSRMERWSQQGRSFIEVINDLQVEVLETTPTEATARIRYIDAGYFVNVETRQQLAPPVSAGRVFTVRLIKDAERWKIDVLKAESAEEF